jgi:site-specific recombinase XerD
MTNKSQETIKSYRNSIKSFIDYINYENDETFTLKKLKGSHIVEFLEFKNNMLQKQQELSIYTKRLLVTHLKMFFSYIEQESEELYDFSKVFERIKIKLPKREPKSLSKEDLKKFKAFLEKLKLRDDFVAVRNLLIIKSILLMGLRESEVKNLKIDDFRVYDGNDSLFEVKIVGKGDKERVVYVKRDLIEDEIDEFKSISDSEYICMTKNKRLMNSDEIFRMVKSAYKRAGIHPDKYNVHSLRHTFAVEFYQKTKDIVVLQRLLGHSDIKTTMIYSHLRQTDISNAVASV